MVISNNHVPLARFIGKSIGIITCCRHRYFGWLVYDIHFASAVGFNINVAIPKVFVERTYVHFVCWIAWCSTYYFCNPAAKHRYCFLCLVKLAFGIVYVTLFHTFVCNKNPAFFHKWQGVFKKNAKLCSKQVKPKANWKF